MKRSLNRIIISGLAVLSLIAQAGAQTKTTPERSVDVKVALSALTMLAESQITDMADALTVAAATEEAQSTDWDKIRPLLHTIEGRFLPANLWFARPDGSYFTLEKGLTDKNLKDRPYFATVLKGQTSIGELVVSKATGENTTIIAVPIKRQEKVVGIFGASVYLDKFGQRLAQAVSLPPDMVFYALDSKGKIALHSQNELVFQEATQLGGPTLAKAVAKMLATPEGEVAYSFAGGDQKAVYQAAPDWAGNWPSVSRPTSRLLIPVAWS